MSTDFAGDRMALEAATDQALAGAREARSDPDAAPFLPAADFLARMIAEQFPEHAMVAGRALMAAAQLLSYGITDEDAAHRIGPEDMLLVAILAADQITREAGAA